jgi:hypothetical protein
MVEESGRNGLLTRTLPLVLSIAPCVFAHGWLVWPVIAIWAVGGGARVRHQDRKAGMDCVMFGIANILVLRRELLQAAGKRWNAWSGVGWSRDGRLSILVGGLVALAVFWTLKPRVYGKAADVASTPEGLPEGTATWMLEQPRPWIFPCRTQHARMFPKRHAFGYSYLLCGFPIVPAGTASDGVDVGDGRDKEMGNWWLRVRAEDYLARGNGALGFYGKLKAFMREQVCTIPPRLEQSAE